MRTGPSTYVTKEIAAYSIDEDDEDLTIIYDSEYKGSRLHRHINLPRDVSDDFDEGLRDEDMYNLAGLAMSSLCLPQDYSDVSSVARPNDGPTHTVPWYQDLPLDDDLPTLHAFISTPVLREPRSYKEAMTTPQAKDWHQATNTELDSLLAKDVYKVVPLPHGTKAISSKFVYKAKLTPTGDIAKFKARVVARGFQQRPGIDYDEKFSPTAKSTSIRTLLALCALLKWKTSQVDVYVAFLNAELKEQVYCIPPPPVVLPKGHAWLLGKSLYGLVQSPRAWYQMLTKKLTDIGFRTSPYDPCVYVHITDTIIISVHVDDIRIYAPHDDVIDLFKAQLAAAFVITSEDPDALYLGMHIEHAHGTIKIHQAEYVRRVLDRYDLGNLPIADTPCDHRSKLTRTPDGDGDAAPSFKKRYL